MALKRDDSDEWVPAPPASLLSLRGATGQPGPHNRHCDLHWFCTDFHALSGKADKQRGKKSKAGIKEVLTSQTDKIEGEA